MRAKADGNDTTDNPIPSAAFEAVGMIGTEVANGILASSVKPAQKAGHMTGAPDRKSACCNAENILTRGCRPHMKGRPDLTPVVDAIVEAATTSNPKQRYLVAPGAPPFAAVFAEKERFDEGRRVIT